MFFVLPTDRTGGVFVKEPPPCLDLLVVQLHDKGQVLEALLEQAPPLRVPWLRRSATWLFIAFLCAAKSGMRQLVSPLASPARPIASASRWWASPLVL